MEGVFSRNRWSSPSVLENLSHNNVDFHLAYFGVEECAPNHAWGPKPREHYVIHVVLDGQGILYHEGKSFPVFKNQAFIMFPGVAHSYQADYVNPWRYIWIGFHGLQAKEFISHTTFSLESPVISLSAELTQLLYRMTVDTIASYKLTYLNELKRQSYILRFLSILLEATTVEEAKPSLLPSSHHAYEVREYLTKNYMNTVKIDALAQAIGISRTYLSSNFQEVFGTSPKAFLMQLRMTKASSLLIHSNSPINEISSLVGYQDSLCFSKSFKKNFGVSPKLYRKLYHNKTTPMESL